MVRHVKQMHNAEQRTNVSTTTAAYANYQNNYKTGTANKKKETADTYTRTVLLLPKSLTAVFTSFSEAVLRLFLPQSYMT